MTSGWNDFFSQQNVSLQFLDSLVTMLNLNTRTFKYSEQTNETVFFAY